jgi:methylglutaconyl-CoA hydratase
MIRVQRHEQPRYAAIAEIVLDRPDKRNALTPDMLDDMLARLHDLSRDDACRGVILRGEGPAFCAGFDLSLCRQTSDSLAAMLRGLSAVVRAMRRLPKPVVVAAHGSAIAGGCALLAAADLVVADRAAKLGYPVVSLGISPAVNAPLLLRAVGPRAARERSLDPALITGDEAKHIGLVHLAVDTPEDVLPRAQIECVKLAEKPPLAFAATKRWLNDIEDSDADEEFDRALAASLALVGSPEERERLTRFLSR